MLTSLHSYLFLGKVPTEFRYGASVQAGKPNYRWQTCTMLPRASRDLRTSAIRWWKKFDDMFSRFDTISNRDRQQTPWGSICFVWWQYRHCFCV